LIAAGFWVSEVRMLAASYLTAELVELRSSKTTRT